MFPDKTFVPYKKNCSQTKHSLTYVTDRKLLKNDRFSDSKADTYVMASHTKYLFRTKKKFVPRQKFMSKFEEIEYISCNISKICGKPNPLISEVIQTLKDRIFQL